MGGMFGYDNSFNGAIEHWNVSIVTEMSQMFLDATIFNQDLSGWCVANIITEPNSFSGYSALTSNHEPDWGKNGLKTNKSYIMHLWVCQGTHILAKKPD